MKKKQFTGATGLTLPRRAVRVLKDRGIFAHSPLSLEHQHLANRYVVRGVESGGAAGDVGRYVTFAAENGQPLEYLHPVEAIGVNGVHAVVITPTLIRIDMLRKGCTYELLITQHGPSQSVNGQRPQLETKILFRGIHGRLELDLAGKDEAHAGSVVPTFYSLAGEEIAIPKRLRQAVRAATKAVNCVGCAHCHYVRAPRKGGGSVYKETKASVPGTALRAGEVEQAIPSPELTVPTGPNNGSTAVADTAA
jgi:hypothetical protein